MLLGMMPPPQHPPPQSHAMLTFGSHEPIPMPAPEPIFGSQEIAAMLPPEITHSQPVPTPVRLKTFMRMRILLFKYAQGKP